jgi:predicted ATPase/DNA-binding NarL/FixJ family response regulator
MAVGGESLGQPWSAPFVGRQRELEALTRQLAEIERGRGAIALLNGEPGIGKTRLAEELCAQAEQRGALVYWGQCFEGEGAPAFWPWVQVVRAWVRGSSVAALQSLLGDEATDIAQVVPDVRQRLGELPAPAPLAPTQARFHLFDSMATVLRRIASRPLVLVLDDLHWADEPSLLLLEFLAVHLADAPVLLIGSYRDVELAPGHALSATLGGLARRPHVQRIHLNRLTPAEVTELVEVTPGLPPGGRVVQAVLDRAEGNPLFVGEMLRLLHSERADAPSRVETDRAVPPTIQDVIGRRLSRLSDACRQVLTIAAVIGREIDLMALRAVFPGQDDQTIDALEEAEAARVVAPVVGDGPTTDFRFTHALIRDTLYEALPSSRRARLHLRVGTALERLAGPASDARLAELAHHFVQAASISPPEQVIRHVDRAAQRAFQALAYEEAARLCTLALRLLEAGLADHLEARCDLLLRLGAAQSAMTDDEASRASFTAAAAIARQLAARVGEQRAAHLLAQAALGYGGQARLEHRSLDARGVGLLEEALAAVGSADSPLRAQLLARLRTATSWQQADAANTPASLEAVALARRVGDPQALADAILYRYHSLTIAEGFDEVPALHAEMEALAKQIGDPVMRMNTQRWLIKYRLEIGDLAAADAAVAEYGRLMAELRYPYTEWRGAVARMSRALLVGDFAAAEQAAEEAAQSGPRQPRQGAPWFVPGELHLLRIEQGRLDEAERLLDALRRDYPGSHGVRSARAWVRYLQGAADEARTELEVLAGDDFAELRQGGAWNYSVTFLCQLCVELEDRARSASLYDVLLPQARSNVVSGITFVSYGAAAHYLARLAASLNRPEAATRHFEDALSLHARLQARPLLAHTRLAYAAALLQARANGTRAQARELARQALDEATALGMPLAQAQASALMVSLGPAEPAPTLGGRPRYPDGLTAREVEVLALLAVGATNAEIARELVLSPGTVHSHTIKIYQKIAVRSRTEAAAYAVRHGLVSTPGSAP